MYTTCDHQYVTIKSTSTGAYHAVVICQQCYDEMIAPLAHLHPIDTVGTLQWDRTDDDDYDDATENPGYSVEQYDIS